MFKTLKGKITFIYSLLVAAMFIIGGISIWNLHSLNQSMEGLMVNNYKSIDMANRMSEAIERQDSAMLMYLSIDKTAGIELFHENGNLFLKWFRIEETNITEAGEKELVDKLGFQHQTYSKLFSELQENKNIKGVNSAIAFYNETIHNNFKIIKTILADIDSLNEKAMFMGRAKLMEKTARTVNALILIFSITIIGGFLLSGYFTDMFLRPVYLLTETIKKLRAGDLNQQAEVVSDDEIGVLASEFNNMTRRLLAFEKSAIGDLMNERNRSVAIVHSISDPLIVLDNNFKIVLINKACENFFDIDEEKSSGRHFLETIRNGELFDIISNAAKNSDKDKSKGTIIQLKSGEKNIFFSIIVTDVKDSESNTIGIVVLFYNITDFKNLEKIKTDFIYVISHEFKTPLTSITMGTSLLSDESVGPLNAKQREIFAALKEDGEKLTGLVNSLLELSRLESGKSVFNISACGVSDIIQNSLKPFYEQARAKKIRLAYHVPEIMPKVDADPDKIVCVINNLVSNALKYTPDEGEILVKSVIENSYAVLSVKDTGKGIDEKYHEKIFERFFRVNEEEGESGGNVGLGLSIAREIIEAHHGKIWCESSKHGSVFYFTIPIHRIELNSIEKNS